MLARILDAPPLSGTIEEHTFHLAGEPVWVLFELDDGTSWAGAFGSDEFRLACAADVAFLQTRPVAFVVAGSRDYLVNYQTRELIDWTDGCSLQEGVLAVQPTETFIAWDDGKLWAVDALGRVLWKSGRVAWDGLRVIRQEGDIVHGEALSPHDGTAVAFEFDVMTGHHRGGNYPC